MMLLLPAPAWAQGYPVRPIKLVVPFPAGGPSDFFSRILAHGLSAELGQQVVLETGAGAGGVAGVDFVAKSFPPDGYTIGLTSGSVLSAIPFMMAKFPFDWQKDLTLLTLVARVREVLVVHPSVPVDTLQDLVAHAKNNSRQGHLRISRHGDLHASAGRAAQDRGRDRCRARALPRRGASGERPARAATSI